MNDNSKLLIDLLKSRVHLFCGGSYSAHATGKPFQDYEHHFGRIAKAPEIYALEQSDGDVLDAVVLLEDHEIIRIDRAEHNIGNPEFRTNLVLAEFGHAIEDKSAPENHSTVSR